MLCKRKFKQIIVIGFVVFLTIALSYPYMKSEVLTRKYGREFEGLEKQTNMISDVQYYKVLSYTDKSAEVFYVSTSGDLLSFNRVNGSWELDEWKTIWTEAGGSASEFMWPYYR